MAGCCLASSDSFSMSNSSTAPDKLVLPTGHWKALPRAGVGILDFSCPYQGHLPQHHSWPEHFLVTQSCPSAPADLQIPPCESPHQDRNVTPFQSLQEKKKNLGKCLDMRKVGHRF